VRGVEVVSLSHWKNAISIYGDREDIGGTALKKEIKSLVLF
jgi:hypothetical protein